MKLNKLQLNGFNILQDGFFIDFDKLMIEQKYKNELERISKLDLSFFYYLTENSPRQIH